MAPRKPERRVRVVVRSSLARPENEVRVSRCLLMIKDEVLSDKIFFVPKTQLVQQLYKSSIKNQA